MGVLRTGMKAHGPFQLEIKNHYPLDLDRLNSFTLDIYLLSPYSLDIHESTYSRPEILSDTHIYTRYTIYDMTLEDLVKEDNLRSPLIRLEELLNSKRTLSEKEMRKILYEFRVLANIFLELMDSREVYFRELVRQKNRPTSLKNEIIQFYKLMETFLSRFRGLSMPGKSEDYENEIRHAFLLADEIISLTIERVLLPLLHLFNDAEGATGKKRIRFSSGRRNRVQTGEKLCPSEQ